MCGRDANHRDCFPLATKVDGLNDSNQVLGVNCTCECVRFKLKNAAS
jgi:hypothetical protein